MEASLTEILGEQLTSPFSDLTNVEALFMEILLKESPELVNKIHEEIDKLVSTGKIDAHDIPNMVLLVSKIYKAHLTENSMEDVSIVNLVKFTLDTILDSGMIPLPQLELKILRKLVDSSLDLLEMELRIFEKEKECCFTICSFGGHSKNNA